MCECHCHDGYALDTLIPKVAPNRNAMDTTKATFCNARAKSRPQVCVDGFISSQEESERARFTPPDL